MALTIGALAQTSQPEWGEVFLQDEIPSVHITIHEDSLEEMLMDENLFSDHEYPASFVYETSLFTDTVDLVGFRLRGNTSRLAAKKSFKVSFNTFVDQQKYKDLKKLNLNGEHNDVSILRSRLNWEGAREFDVPASRTNHVRLYINEEYKGLYLNVEHIDNRYLGQRFDANTGNLYKCFYGANLQYLGNDPDVYKLAPWGNRIYELKTNETDDDYTGLAQFIDVLNNTPINDLPCDLEEVFNVQDYLKAAALEIVWGHWDGYIYNNNNFYLYDNPDDGRFHFLPYDLDNTLGIDWLGEDWSERNIYNWDNPDPRPLFQRLMQVDAYRSDFTWYVNEALQSVFDPTTLLDRANEMQALIQNAALEDEYKELDYGFTNDDFLNAITEAWGGHVEMSIENYVNIRAESALEQLEALIEPFELTTYDSSPWAEGNLDLLAYAGMNASSVQASLMPSTGGTMIIDMFDDGLHNDLLPNDGWFGAQIPVDATWEYMEYQLTASDGETEEISPCTPKKVWTSWSNNGLVINEVMPSNTNFLADEFGEYDDWVEIYNVGPASKDLSHYHLTNKLEEPNKWHLPQIILSPGEFTLLWLDDQTEQGVSHGNFTLDATLDDLTLTTMDENIWRTVDHIAWENMTTDESLGRETDGNTPWVIFTSPTPNASNNNVHISESTAASFQVYPNPTQDLLKFEQRCSGSIFSADGRIVCEFRETDSINMKELDSGVYIIHTSLGIARVVKE